VTSAGFDIWVHAITPATHAQAAEALSRALGISFAAAETSIASLPCLVKSNASPEQTQSVLAALYAVGGRAEAVAHQATWHAEPELAPLTQPVEDTRRDPLALPAAPPPAGRQLRSPSERERDPERRTASPRTATARLDVRGLVAPVQVALGIWDNAERSSWQHALRGHPVAGFLIVMLATTSVFLLVYAAM
jgi:hypothetical protein